MNRRQRIKLRRTKQAVPTHASLTEAGIPRVKNGNRLGLRKRLSLWKGKVKP